MTAILRLLYLYFAADTWRRWFSLAGLVLIIFCVVESPLLAHSSYMQFVGFAGMTMLYLGSSLMPLVLCRLMRGNISSRLPYGQFALVASGLLTTAVVSMPLPVLSVLTMMETFPAYRSMRLFDVLRWPFFWQMYAAVFLLCSWLYYLHWLFTVSRTVKGLIRAVIVMIVAVAVPPKYLALEATRFNPLPVILIVASWSALALCMSYGNRLRDRLQAIFSAPVMFWNRLIAKSFAMSAAVRGREEQLLLGIGSRWLHALAIGVVIALDVLLIRDQNVWLFYLVLLATVVGAVSVVATVRSRSLWLRRPWSRSVLFMQIEQRMWRHMGLSLVVMLCWFAAASLYADMAMTRIGSGLLLIALTFMASLYLGLMQTRGLMWRDAVVAIGVSLSTMMLAVYAARPAHNDVRVLALEVLLLLLGIAFRYVAKQRWIQLDWTLCRPLRAERIF